MHLSVFFLLILYVVLGSATPAFAPNHVKRGAQQNATLYAYGANTPQWPIAYGRTDSEYNVCPAYLVTYSPFRSPLHHEEPGQRQQQQQQQQSSRVVEPGVNHR